MTKPKEIKGKPGAVSTWSEEDNETLRRMAAQRYSGSQIAAELGRTRSAVLGRANRLGIHLISNAGNVGRVFAPGGQEPKRRERTHRARPMVLRPLQPVPLDIIPPPVPEPVPAGDPVTLDQLTRQSCRYIAGDPLKVEAPFCGAPRKAGSAYCSAHHALCYVPAPRIKETRLRPGMARAAA
jgi:GcrA cell cycle regulator